MQRYPDRALLLATDRCAIYCRFCTRSRIVGSGGGPRSELRLMPALEYLRAHPEIRDLIISGGDPLAMSTTRIVRILQAVRCIPSIETIRIATRMPVALPQRITYELVQALRAISPDLDHDPLQPPEGAHRRKRARACGGWWTAAFR